MIILALLVVAFVVYQLSGNRKMIAADASVKQGALSSTPSPDRARLFLYRVGFVGKAVGADFSVDGQLVAQLKGNRFTFVDVMPGSHQVTVKFGGMGLGGPNGESRTVEVTAGGSMAVYPQIQMGMLKSTIQLCTEADLALIRKRLASLKMIVPEATPKLPERQPG